MKRLLPLGPLLFAVVLAALTLAQYDFLRGLGWHPLRDPTFDWPSGLALGPWGLVMTLTFPISGGLLALLGRELLRTLPPGPASTAGALLLAAAGLALAGLGFTTDPTLRTTPATWHGRLHDLSFVLLGLTLMPAMLCLGAAFRREPRRRAFGLYTWATAALALPTFFIKGAAFYVFLAAVLAWMEWTALLILRLDRAARGR